MQVVQFGQQLNTPIVICLGYFGCMHKGHVRLLEIAKLRAREHNAKVALFTFSNNHLKVLGKNLKVVYSFEERLEIYQNLGVDFVVESRFDDSFRNTAGKRFLQQLSCYNLKGVVCGFDYSCGCDRINCNEVTDYLKSVCPVDVVEAVCWRDHKISTTLVRSLLERGDISDANVVLSEPYFLIGTVVSGRHVGTQIGFPTANVQVDSDKVLPIGVFSGQVNIGDKSYKAIVNIGSKPTFGLDSFTVEVHIVDFMGELYGSKLKVSLTKYLRGIRKFDSAEQLIEQLQKDKESALHD